MKKLAIITTHPIQYNAPLFRLLNERNRIAVKVFYTWSQSEKEVYDAKFGLQRSWDIPLLEGYDYAFVNNTSKHPDSNRFFGIQNPGFLQQLKKEQFDAVLVYRWSVFSHLNIMQRLGGRTKLFFRGDSHVQNDTGGIRSIIKKAVLKWVYRNVDIAFYVGRYNKTYLQKYGLKEQQLIAAPHAIDNNRFTTNDQELELRAATEREQLNIPADAVVFLYAGKFYALKQLDLLIHAFKQLSGEQYRLLLYGNGEQEEQLKEMAKADHRILFQPFRNQSDMPWVYRVGDVFVLPSKSETWGLGVNEAMACSRTALVSDQCGCAPDLIVQQQTGFVFQHKSEADLLKRMQQFSSKKTAKQMGQQAFTHISQYSLQQVAEAIEAEVLR
ncbi:MAG: glycosyltransferase family 4 protein [Chitinophagaceae bacterium]|nr:glycosyltransferase family 4 protein [Chitinophagaceae bacterium]